MHSLNSLTDQGQCTNCMWTFLSCCVWFALPTSVCCVAGISVAWWHSWQVSLSTRAPVQEGRSCSLVCFYYTKTLDSLLPWQFGVLVFLWWLFWFCLKFLVSLKASSREFRAGWMLSRPHWPVLSRTHPTPPELPEWTCTRVPVPTEPPGSSHTRGGHGNLETLKWGDGAGALKDDNVYEMKVKLGVLEKLETRVKISDWLGCGPAFHVHQTLILTQLLPLNSFAF